MKNHWVKQYQLHNQYQWMFMVGRNSVFQLKPRIVKVPERPGQSTEGPIRVIFSNVPTKDDELYTFLSDNCYGKKKTNHCAYLRLVDTAVQPIETWAFEKIKFNDIEFNLDDDSGVLDIETSFSFRTMEYRDFLRKVRHKYSK